MKKKIFGSVAVLAIAAVAAFNVNMGFNSQNEELSALTLSNVEELAQQAELPNLTGYISMVITCFDKNGYPKGSRTVCYSGGAAKTCRSTDCPK